MDETLLKAREFLLLRARVYAYAVRDGEDEEVIATYASGLEGAAITFTAEVAAATARRPKRTKNVST